MAEPTTTPTSDEHLMSAFAGGDALAFEQLYARHHTGLYRFVRRVLGSTLAAQADEVFQDTWLRVVQAREQWQPQGASFRTWLYTLGHNRAVDQLRRSGREVAFNPHEDDPDRDPFEPADTPWSAWPGTEQHDAESRLFWHRAGERLLQCLDQLPAAQKTVFLLHHDEGCSVDEVAAALQLGFETVKSRLRYAMSKLRVCMGAHLPAELSK